MANPDVTELLLRIEKLELAMSHYVGLLNDTVNAIFVPGKVGIHNVPIKQGETPQDYEIRIKTILHTLSFGQEVDLVDSVAVSTKYTSIVTFKNSAAGNAAAESVLRQEAKFHCAYWGQHNRPDMIKNLTALKDQATRILSRVPPGQQPPALRHGGYIHVSRWRRPPERSGPRSSASAQNGPPRSGIAEGIL